MEPAGLLSFPAEILHHIGKCLAAEDILNVSQTCKYLRATFNDNSVWQKFIPESIILLKSIEPILEPKIKLDTTFNSDCDNLTLYKMKKHLLNNWKLSNFLRFRTKTRSSYTSEVYNISKGKWQIIYEDKYIFLGRFTNNVCSDGIEVWNIENEPYVHCFLPLQNKYYDNFYIIGCNLVVVECRRINVYQIVFPEKRLPLLYSFCVTESDVTWNELAKHPGQCDTSCLGRSQCIADQYLVSYCFDEERTVMHVWDILNASKLVDFVIPFQGFSRGVIHHGDSNWLMGHPKADGDGNFYFFFNIKDHSFSETVLNCDKLPKHTIIYQSHLLLFENVDKPNSDGEYDSVCVVFNLKTSKEVKRRRFNNARKNFLSSTIVENGKFVILCFDCFQIVDALTLETVDHFQCDLDTRFITHQFNVHGSLFVVTACGDNLLYMWDVENKRKLQKPLEPAHTSRLHLSGSCSKLVTVDNLGICVRNFW